VCRVTPVRGGAVGKDYSTTRPKPSGMNESGPSKHRWQREVLTPRRHRLSELRLRQMRQVHRFGGGHWRDGEPEVSGARAVLSLG
jgi:hypothetical protein